MVGGETEQEKSSRKERRQKQSGEDKILIS